MAPANSWSSITSRDPLRINGFKRTKPALLFDNIGHKELSSVQKLPRFNLRFGFLGHLHPFLAGIRMQLCPSSTTLPGHQSEPARFPGDRDRDDHPIWILQNNSDECRPRI